VIVSEIERVCGPRVRLTLRTAIETWPMASPLQISGYTFSEFQVVVVTLFDGTHEGRGEAAGVYFLGDVPKTILAVIEDAREHIESGITCQELRELLPPGGARNAVDCALWDLQSKRTGKSVWALAGMNAPRPLLTTFTLGADTPHFMAERAREKFRDAKAIKLKLLGDDVDADRVRAVRAARDDVWLAVDANQGLTVESLNGLLPTLVAARVQLLEQPFKVGHEALLDALDLRIPVAADETVQSLEHVPALAGRFDVMNIKLDKCGGLTEALLMAEQGRRLGLGIMVGCMSGTSLAMAPAILVGQGCEVVDLDAPLFLKSDREPSVSYRDGSISVPAGVWGGLSA
jgi:L-alanine-DL-glutamate epimerase-like enolase superfamily enzyme